jgi:hypothetical protein
VLNDPPQIQVGDEKIRMILKHLGCSIKPDDPTDLVNHMIVVLAIPYKDGLVRAKTFDSTDFSDPL